MSEGVVAVVETKRITWVWTGLTLAAMAALVGTSLMGMNGVPGIFKQIASTCFLLTAFSLGAFATRYGKLIFAGLILSWWGDAFLIGSTDLFFQLGLVSFLLAHVLYSVAFAMHGVNLRWCLVVLVPLVPLVLVLVRWLWPGISDDLRPPVVVYMVVISLMVMFAVGTRGRGGHWTLPLGAILFYLSDVAVARGQFIESDFPNYVWGLPTYYSAQLLLAWSVGVGKR